MSDADRPDPFASARDIAAAVASGRWTASAVIETTLARIEAHDRALNAFTLVTTARARAAAAMIDARRKAGEKLPPLAGVPYAVKNLFDLAGEVTLAGSHVLAGEPPADRDAVLVERMDAAGAICVGALNMDEFAYGFTTENSHAGPSRNPHSPAHSAGGSSGGCGAAVGGGLVPISLGSDTNGSIRVPSSFCGIWGLKPTYGRLPRTGSYPFVYSLDHLGLFARTVEDLALAYDAMQGHDAGDLACAERPAEPALARLAEGGALRVGVLGGWFADQAGEQARRAVALAAGALGATETVVVPGAEAGRAAAFLITASEGGELHRLHLRERYDDMEPLSRDRLAAGALLPAAWVQRAQRVRAQWRLRMLQAFERFDLLLAPATPIPAPRLPCETVVINGRTLPARPNIGLLTQPISCIGLPVVAAPVETGDTLPLGVQLIAAPWAEVTALRAARKLEQAGIALARAVPEPAE
ncbi:AtzE family amidohydrolase [Derxia gummosa]|uniref:AtzE family amidohydrolase n=1 Tax=Derxia gummosa DSM 723 TaxID=1121388 RepID=A0A8B6X590_9BURK|nr:AtzE family amidohydrolase [Derxia gummosa]